MLKQHVLFVPNFSLSSSDCSHAAAADDDDVVRMPLLVYVRNFVRMFFLSLLLLYFEYDSILNI